MGFTRQQFFWGNPPALPVLGVPVVDKFPDLYLIRYNLACYACQLGNLEEAKQWLDKAFDIADKESVKLMVLKDPDLEPLWGEIAKI